MENTPFIHIENLSYSYVGEDEQTIPVLKDLSLNICEGEYVVILGHNGSGKSTFAKLLNMVIDDYTYAEGKIVVDGMDVMSPDLTDDDVLSLRKNVGMVFQNPDNQLVATVVEEDVAFGPENLGIPQPELRTRVDEALATVGMTKSATKLLVPDANNVSASSLVYLFAIAPSKDVNIACTVLVATEPTLAPMLLADVLVSSSDIRAFSASLMSTPAWSNVAFNVCAWFCTLSGNADTFNTFLVNLVNAILFLLSIFMYKKREPFDSLFLQFCSLLCLCYQSIFCF